jgi:hypothetical protein
VLNLSDAAALVTTGGLVNLVNHGYLDLKPSRARRREQYTHHAGLADLHTFELYRAPLTSQAHVTAVGTSAAP